MKTELVQQQVKTRSGTVAAVCNGEGEDEDEDGKDGEKGQGRDLKSDKGPQQQDKGRTDFEAFSFRSR